MIKVDIFSGFLGAGKTTLIKKLIKEAYKGEKLVLIENEFGQIGIDGGFMKEAGIEITEMNSGCICCSLVGDFGEALKKVIADLSPERILIEPSGVGKLSDVIKAVKDIDCHDVELNAFTTVVDANKCKMYMRNFGEFFNNQIENASSIVLSHTGNLSEEKVQAAVDLIRTLNKDAVIISTDWDALEGKQILAAMENSHTLQTEIEKMKEEHHAHAHEHCECGHNHEHHHHHHHHHHDEECDCGCHHEHHHHDHDEECECKHGHHHGDEGCKHHHEHDHEHEHCECGHDHEHEHHHHDEECDCGCHHDHEHHHEHHEHHHEHHDGHECHDPNCSCHDHHDHHHDHHHGHHHADEVFSSWGAETAKKFTAEEITEKLSALSDAVAYGIILRAKGIVEGKDGRWIHFDYIPGSVDVRFGGAEVTGRLCVIGSKIDEHEIEELFLK